uniref:Lysozyme n=1 Tax=Caenorhabditis japonica TaxID=281687 RepID=A0A8R1HKF2_CAEJA
METNHAMKFLLALFALVGAVSAGADGLDFIQATSVATMQCLRNNGISFVIPRIFTSLGTIDQTGINNVKNAHAAGISYIDGYLFPCLATRCGSGGQQVKEALDALASQGTKIGTIWLDIERLAWPANHVSNRAFIQSMVNEAQARKQLVGIYSNYYNWQDIVGLDYTGLSHLPLWWAEYDGEKDFGKYRSFGGWAKPNIHQWAGDQAGPCGVSVDWNFIPA